MVGTNPCKYTHALAQIFYSKIHTRDTKGLAEVGFRGTGSGGGGKSF